MVIEDYLILIPGVLMLVGVGLAIRPPRAWGEKTAVGRAFCIYFAAGSAALLAISAWQTLSRNAHIGSLRDLTPGQVTGIRLDRYRITGAQDIQAIVRALNTAKAYSPDHGNFADDVTLEIATRNGRDVRVTVSWSFEKPGAVIWFYSGDPDRSFVSYGYAFCESLPAALEKAGYRIPRFRGDRLIRALTPDDVRAVRVDGLRVSDRRKIAELLAAFQNAGLGSSRSEVNPSASRNIVFETVDRGAIHIQAAPRPATSEVVFWYVTGDSPETAITHGCHAGDSRLKKALEDLIAGQPGLPPTAPAGGTKPATQARSHP